MCASEMRGRPCVNAVVDPLQRKLQALSLILTTGTRHDPADLGDPAAHLCRELLGLAIAARSSQAARPEHEESNGSPKMRVTCIQRRHVGIGVAFVEKQRDKEALGADAITRQHSRTNQMLDPSHHIQYR